MFSSTLSSSMRLKLWNTKPICPLRMPVRSFSFSSDTSWPSSQYWPEVGLSSSPRMFSSVDLPHPEGPIIATNSPSSTLNVTLSSAIVSTSSVRNDLLRFSTFIIFCSILCPLTAFAVFGSLVYFIVSILLFSACFSGVKCLFVLQVFNRIAACHAVSIYSYGYGYNRHHCQYACHEEPRAHVCPHTEVLKPFARHNPGKNSPSYC